MARRSGFTFRHTAITAGIALLVVFGYERAKAKAGGPVAGAARRAAGR